MNSFILIGKALETPISKETSNGKKYSKIRLQEKRAYKNANDEYENDTYEVTVWGNSNLDEIKEDDLISIKGRLQSYNYEKDNNIYHNIELIGEKINVYHDVI